MYLPSLTTMQYQNDIQSVVNALLKLALFDMSLEGLLQKSLEIILSVPAMAADKKGAILLTGNDSETLVIKAQKGLSLSQQKSYSRVKFGHGLCGKAAQTKQIQTSTNDLQPYSSRIDVNNPYVQQCAPILLGEEILGVLSLYVPQRHLPPEQEIEFLTAITDTLASMIVRKKGDQALQISYQELQLTLDGIVNALAVVAEKRDPYTAGHQQRVAGLACAIARQMGLNDTYIRNIKVAALLHDIGKINIPSEILSRPGKLTDIEIAFIRCHPVLGNEILRQIPFSGPIAQIVLQHHERIDGSGYPNGLQADEIMLEAKIIAVADVLEAMSTHRPYRPALGIEKAREELMRYQGICYDYQVVEACKLIITEDMTNASYCSAVL